MTTPSFKPKKYYKTLDGWFIELRPGDEETEKNYIKPRIRKIENIETPIAGPFRTKIELERWIDGFLSFYAKRDREEGYIPDSIVFPDMNTMYIRP